MSREPFAAGIITSGTIFTSLPFFPRFVAGIVTISSFHTIFCIDSSSENHGPPASAKPSQICTPSSRFRESAQCMAYSTTSQNSGESCCAFPSNSGFSFVPRIGMRYVPLSPTFFIPSRSAFIAGLETAPYIQYQKLNGSPVLCTFVVSEAIAPVAESRNDIKITVFLIIVLFLGYSK